MSDQTPNTPQPEGPVPGVSQDDKNMALLAHLLGIVLSVIGPLIIWLVKKDQSRFVEDQAKEALNFQITLLIAGVVAGILSCIGIGVVLFPIIWLADLVFSIMAAVKVSEGVLYRYPVNWRLVR